MTYPSRSRTGSITLTLPLPPSPNDRGGHWATEHRAKNRYRAHAWMKAVEQHPPRAVEDLPQRVRITATFYVSAQRDEMDNLWLKYVLDCLKQRQKGKLVWRNGICDQKGYFIDDDPKHIEPGRISQVVDRKNPRLVLEITPIA